MPTLYDSNIPTRRRSLLERLGRDLGTPVASLHHSEIAERLQAYTVRLFSRLINCSSASGPVSLVNFELAMKGTRSLAK